MAFSNNELITTLPRIVAPKPRNAKHVDKSLSQLDSSRCSILLLPAVEDGSYEQIQKSVWASSRYVSRNSPIARCRSTDSYDGLADETPTGISEIGELRRARNTPLQRLVQTPRGIMSEENTVGSSSPLLGQSLPVILGDGYSERRAKKRTSTPAGSRFFDGRALPPIEPRSSSILSKESCDEERNDGDLQVYEI